MMEKLSLRHLIDPEFLAEIKAADTDNDPLAIVDNFKFTQEQYEQAKDFEKKYVIENHDFYKNSDGQHVFDIHLAAGFLHFDVKVVFTLKEILSVKVDSKLLSISSNYLEALVLIYFLQYFIRENPTEDTNTAAHLLLNRFLNEDSELPITLRAYIKSSDYEDFPTLSFKIGQDSHLYKVQNLSYLLRIVRTQEHIKLGKYFNRSINVNKMDKDSLAWYRLIEDVVESNNAIEYFRNSYMPTGIKEIPVQGAIADRVNDLLKQGIKLYFNNKSIFYDEDTTKLPLKIKYDPENQKAVVKIDYILPPYKMDNIIEGNKYFYYYDWGSWIWYSKIDLHFMQRYRLRMGEELIFGEKNLQTLGRKILPEFKTSKNFNITGMKQVTDALPPEAEFEFKLDLVEQDIVCEPVVKYGETSLALLDKNSLGIARQMVREEKIKNLLNELAFKERENKYQLALNRTDAIDHFFDQGLNQLKHAGKVKVSAAFRRLLGNAKSKFNLHLGISLSQNTLKLDLSDSDLSMEDVDAILNAYQQKRHYVMLRSGQLQKVEQPSLEQLATIMRNLNLNLKQFVHGKLELPAYRAFYLEKMLKNRNDLEFTSDQAFKNLTKDLTAKKIKQHQVPEALNATLRPYQTVGFDWLATLTDYRLSGLLADEMGLGKTIQVISLLLKNYEKTTLPSLIVTPASVVYNWQQEFKKFAPNLPVMALGGSKKERRDALEKLDKQIVITSYDSLKRDLELYQELNFEFEILDEAQYIKNAKSIAAKSVKIIKANHRFALTGTPIENNLSELWSIFNFLMPGFLGKYDYFKNNYEKPIVENDDQKQAKLLGQIIAPFVLRRLKKDVLKDLPEKTEQVIKIAMSGKQKQLYEAQTKNLLAKLGQKSDLDFKKQRIEILAEITKLRQLCCDPHLLYEDYQGKSAKLGASLDLIKANIEEGHKILLFSQFTSMLDIFKQKLDKLKLPYFVITGQTTKEKRQELIKKFNNLKEPAIFLISLKAGGTGINLTSADVVVHYDPWWNLSAENQATDRAHRIGQKHNVQIYKMVAQDTIEEKIIELQKKKDKLAQDMLSSDAMSLSKFEKDDLLAILAR